MGSQADRCVGQEVMGDVQITDVTWAMSSIEMASKAGRLPGENTEQRKTTQVEMLRKTVYE